MVCDVVKVETPLFAESAIWYTLFCETPDVLVGWAVIWYVVAPPVIFAFDETDDHW